MGAIKLKYYEQESALEVNPKFFGKPLEKNDSKPFFCLNAYTYGFNSYERLDELSGSGNSYDFGARIYSPRLGKFFSTDPREKDFASWAPYSFVGNMPIRYIDENGEGPGDFIRDLLIGGRIKLKEWGKKFVSKLRGMDQKQDDKRKGNYKHVDEPATEDPSDNHVDYGNTEPTVGENQDFSIKQIIPKLGKNKGSKENSQNQNKEQQSESKKDDYYDEDIISPDGKTLKRPHEEGDTSLFKKEGKHFFFKKRIPKSN